MKKTLILLLAFLVISLTSAWSLEHEAMVYVVHGIPGIALNADQALPVDISVNGACVITDFKYQGFFGPISLAPGEYEIAIRPANLTSPCSEDPVIEATVPIHADETCTIIAHLTEDGSVTASKFTHDVSPIKDKSRIVIHHCAAAPAVDMEGVRLTGPRDPDVRVSELSNGDKFMLELKQKSWLFKIYYPPLSGNLVDQKLFNLKIWEGIYIFAVGTPQMGLDWVWIRIGGLSEALT